MSYTLDISQKAPLLDGQGNPIASTAIEDGNGTQLPLTGPIATIQDDGSGFAELIANGVGTTSPGLRLKATGETVTHTITVTSTAAPFDWTLGTAVPK